MRNQIAAQGDHSLVPAINNPTNSEFSVTECELYVPVLSLSSENQNKLLGKLKEGLKITVSWN